MMSIGTALICLAILSPSSAMRAHYTSFNGSSVSARSVPKDSMKLCTALLLALNLRTLHKRANGIPQLESGSAHLRLHRRIDSSSPNRAHQVQMHTSLPIETVLPEIVEALKSSSSWNLVLQAPPGAGKTTVVPLAILQENMFGLIMVLEPRRVAARSAAMRMASLLNEKVGEQVGYRIRGEGESGPRTRVLVVTEGVLLRRLQRDPELNGIDLVIFDEFHERSVTADVCLALCRRAQLQRQQKLAHSGLGMLVMSATLGNTSELQKVLGGCDVVTSEGRSFPVKIKHIGDQPLKLVARQPPWEIGEIVANAVTKVLAETQGDLLAFLPGEGEIRNTKRLLEDKLESRLLRSIEILPLFGAMDLERQRQVIAPHNDGIRRVILATPIAESSLTIEGVRVVVDSGLRKISVFDQETGLSALRTVPISLASATQRSGRAGRVASGMAYRLWTEREELKLIEQTPPEIEHADFAQPALALASCGIVGQEKIASIPWLAQPPLDAVIVAQELLLAIGALRKTPPEEGITNLSLRPTPYAARLSDLPLHPRLAHMILSVRGGPLEERASLIAALVSERDIFQGGSRKHGNDIRLRLDALQSPQAPETVNINTWRRIKKEAKEILHILRGPATGEESAIGSEDTMFRLWIEKAEFQDGILLALAFPDRVGQLRNDRYHLSNGKVVSSGHKGIECSEFLVAAVTSGSGTRSPRIELSAPISLDAVRFALRSVIEEEDEVFIAPSDGSIRSRHVTKLGSLVLSAHSLPPPTSEEAIPLLLKELRERGLEHTLLRPEIKSGQAARELIARVALLRTLHGSAVEWPTWTEESLLDDAEIWLNPALRNAKGLKDLQRSNIADMLKSTLGFDEQRILDTQAPETLILPSGVKHQLKYARSDRLLPERTSDSTNNQPPLPPILTSKVQEWFGSTSGPKVGGPPGEFLEVNLDLQSPRGATMAIVSGGLSAFWRNTYPSVRTEGKGRYPKHPWPEDPLIASPTRMTKKQLEKAGKEIGITDASSKSKDGRKKASKKRRKR